VDTTLHYAEGRPPESDDRPANAPASATNLSFKVAPASRIPPDAAAFSLASLPAHLAASIAIDPESLEWIWTGRLDRDGYGRVGIRGVHREVYKGWDRNTSERGHGAIRLINNPELLQLRRAAK
jgi:hypothetical protein